MDNRQVLQALKRLRGRSDMSAVRRAIVGLAGPSGPIKSYTVNFDTSRQTVSCFLEMKSPMLESEVRELNACGFGNSLCVEFALGCDSVGAT
jgi:hypothetical protein